MKFILLVCFLCCSFEAALAQRNVPYEQSIIRSVDDFDIPQNYIDVSEEGLPRDHYLQLLQKMNVFRFTPLPDTKVRDFFNALTRNSKARMRHPGGKCSQRRAYIQNQLKRDNIVSGRIMIRCPEIKGRLRLRDRVSGRYFTYSNFHDANVIAVKTNAGVGFRVLDLQFQDHPVTLHEYLTEIEASQKIRPTKRRGSGRNFCYWTISTPFLTY